jgi:tetratricopeptide (TPR) repeat protein
MPLAEILTEASSGQIVESLSTIAALTQSGQLRSAMEETLFALQHAPTYLSLHVGMADLLVREGRLQEAAEKYETIARTYHIRGESDRAVNLYHRIIELIPTNLTVRSRLIDLLVSCGRLVEAIQQLSSLAEVYYSLADLEKARNTYTEALRLGQQSKVDRSLRIQILHRMADIDLQSLDWRQALRIFEQIRTIQPEDEPARANLVLINFRLGQESAGMEELDSAVNYLAASAQPGRAIHFLESLVQENPEVIPVRRRLAEGYRQVGRMADAIREFDQVGDRLLEAGDRQGAIAAVEAILAMNPDNRKDYQDALIHLRS